MKKIILILILLLMVGSVIATHYDFKKYNLYTYSEDVDWYHCMKQFDCIPYHYWDGIKEIRVYNDREYNVRGRYYISGLLVIDEIECSMDIITHELAHHQQWITGDPLYELEFHTGNFNKYLDEIEESVNCNQ